MTDLRRIAYVEDDADLRAIAEIALADLGGFDVKLCASGAEAIETLPSFSPDLILLDVRMPGLDGPATLASLRDMPALSTTPAVFVTADHSADQTDALLELGAAGVMAKPFDPVRLPADLSDIWRHARRDMQESGAQ